MLTPVPYQNILNVEHSNHLQATHLNCLETTLKSAYTVSPTLDQLLASNSLNANFRSESRYAAFNKLLNSFNFAQSLISSDFICNAPISEPKRHCLNTLLWLLLCASPLGRLHKLFKFCHQRQRNFQELLLRLLDISLYWLATILVTQTSLISIMYLATDTVMWMLTMPRCQLATILSTEINVSTGWG